MSLIRDLVVSKLDFCNSVVLAGLPSSLMRRWQPVLHPAARLMFLVRSEHITPLLVNFIGYGLRNVFSFVCVFWHTNAFTTAHHHETLHLTSDIESRCSLRSWSTSTLLVPSILDEPHSVIELDMWLRHERGTHPSDCRHHSRAFVEPSKLCSSKGVV